MWKTIDDLKKQAEVLTDVVMHLKIVRCHRVIVVPDLRMISSKIMLFLILQHYQ